MSRQAIVIRRAWNTETRTFDLVLSSGEPVLRFDMRGAYEEILSLDHRNILERFREQYGDRTVLGLQSHHIEQILDRVKGPHARKRLRSALSLLMQHAKKMGLRPDNPLLGVEKVKVPESEGFLTWTEEEIAQFRAYWGLGTPPDLSLNWR